MLPREFIHSMWETSNPMSSKNTQWINLRPIKPMLKSLANVTKTIKPDDELKVLSMLAKDICFTKITIYS